MKWPKSSKLAGVPLTRWCMQGACLSCRLGTRLSASRPPRSKTSSRRMNGQARPNAPRPRQQSENGRKGDNGPVGKETPGAPRNGFSIEPDPEPRNSPLHKRIVEIAPIPGTRSGQVLTLECGHVVQCFGNIEHLHGLALCQECRQQFLAAVKAMAQKQFGNEA